MRTDVLILVEDAGAANMAAPLPAALEPFGLSTRLVAAGAATRQLRDLGTPSEPLDGRSAKALLADAAPRLVAVGTSEDADAVGLDLVTAARALSIPNAGLVDAPTNATSRFRGRGSATFGHAPDALLVADAATRSDFVAAGWAASRIEVVGHPHRDRVRAERRRLDVEGRASARARVLPDAPADRPVLVLLAEASDGLDPAQFRRTDDYTLLGRGRGHRRTDIVIEEVLDAAATMVPRPWILLRPHAKNGAGEFDGYRAKVGRLGRDETMFDLLYAADLVVGLTTAALDEAALLGRPTLSVVPRAAEAAWLASAGLTPVAHDRAMLRHMLSERIGAAGPRADDLDRAFPPGATERAARALARLATVA
ncbi:MAG: hypothetical protein WD673_12040 [Alphaproteobacteria bacterium]